MTGHRVLTPGTAGSWVGGRGEPSSGDWGPTWVPEAKVQAKRGEGDLTLEVLGERVKRGVPELIRVGRSSSVCERVAGRGGSAMVAPAWAPRWGGKGVGLDVSRVKSGKLSNSSRSELQKQKRRLSHGRKRRREQPGPNPTPTQYVPVLCTPRAQN